MKPAKLNLKYKRINGLWLLLCALGVALVAWWAWAAGPVETKSALSAGSKVQTQPALNGSGYNSVNSAAQGSSAQASGSSGSASSGTSASPVAPSGTQPSGVLCPQVEGGVQPDIIYPCGCGSSGAAYPCCVEHHPGIEILCPNRY